MKKTILFSLLVLFASGVSALGTTPKSDGVVIITLDPINATNNGGILPLAESYKWWNWSGSISIPDGSSGSGTWVGINCSAPSGVPSGAVVTKVKVHHEITHTFIGDLEVKIYNEQTSHVWMVRNREGGSADNINETKTEYSIFDGDNPTQKWYYRVRDVWGGDTGTLDVMQLYVYYETPKPDLIVQDISISPSSPVAGQSVTITATLKNQGDASAGRFYLKYYVDGSYIGQDDCYFGLDPGESDTESISYTVSSSGNHTIRVDVDTTYVIDESNEGNNSRSETYYWSSPPKPDLIVQDISISPSSPTAGQSATITATIKNQGNADAGSFKIKYYVDGSYIGEDTLSFGLNAGSSNNETIGYTASSSGNHTVKVVADSSYQISESSETNNERQETYYWNIPPKPDLVAYSISVSDNTVNPGQSITVYWTAKNQGSGSCGGTQQGVMWSTNSTISMSDTWLENEYLGGLSPGQSTPESHTITIPGNATPGSTYYIGIIADYDDDEDESNESNNDDGTPAAVTINIPDLIAYGTGVDDNTVTRGQSVTVTWTAKNQGNGNCGSSQQGVLWSTDSNISKSDPLLEKEFLGPMDSGDTTAEVHTVTVPMNATYGATYYIGVYEDYDEIITESSEGNNASGGVPVTIIDDRPDLIGYNLSVSDNTVDPGQSITVYWTAGNQGLSTSGACQQGIMWSTDNTIDGSDTLLDKEYLGQLNPSETTPEAHTVAIPAGATPGSTYYIGVIMDCDNDIDESNESNNVVGPIAVTINAASADLGVTVFSMAWAPGDPRGQNPVSGSYTIANYGPFNVSDDSYRIDFYLSTDATITVGDTKIGDNGITITINSGQSVGYTMTPTGLSFVTIPSDMPPGIYYVGMHLVPTGTSPVDPLDSNNWRADGTVTIPSVEIRIEPLTINIDAEVGGAVSSQSLMTPSSSIKALDISDPNSNLGEISLDEIVIRFRAEESAVLHTYRVVDNLSNAELLAVLDTLGKEALPGEILGLQPFVAGAKKIQEIVSHNQSLTEIITSDNSLSASEIDLVSDSIKNNIEDHGPSGLFYAKIAQSIDIRDICIELMQRADVVYAHPSPVCHIEAAPNDPLYSRMWNLERIGMPEAWDVSGNTPTGVRVCVMDTGVRLSHGELTGRTADATDIYTTNGDAYADSDPDNDDEDGHGTACAGIIAAIRNNSSIIAGIAPVTIIPVNGYGLNVDNEVRIYNYTDGVYWGVDHNADVISLSLGGDRSAPYQAELEAAAYAENHGVIVCAAAGNGDGNADDHYPSAIPYYISVAAVDDDDMRVTQPKWWWGSNHGNTVDICAPGQGDVGASNDSILTLDRDSDSDWTNSFNGTSSATPHVAGVCALLAHVNPSLTAQEIRNIIQTTAEDQIGDPSEDVAGWDQFHGHGLINAASAIAMATHSFTIFNDGSADLHVTDIAQRDGDDWLLSWNPSAPLTISPGESQIVTISIDPELADIGSNDERLLVYSDDNDESPYPGGVYVNLTVTCVSTTIEQPPQDITICEGQDAEFDIVATGSEPLQYQWKKDGSDVGSDSSTLILPSVQLEDDGSEIWCEVTNACGSVVVSTSAFLTVYPWPTVTINPNPDQLNADWILDGPNGYTYSNNGDETIADLEFGSYTITWATIPRWNTPLPNPDIKNLSVQNSINFIGNYQLIADLNNDYSLDFKDLAMLTNEWQWTGQPGSIPEDIVQDGIVNFLDFAVLAENWLEGSR